ncbi:hypothetical protein C8Q76DRAFT_754793 [Earliella scabrosa]|nr:hypothetical protein C8Q76DRAFT_754793 [Earliella scabrosa]
MFYRWGMEERLHERGIKCKGTMFASFDSGSVVASQDWESDVLDETGGDFLLIHYSELRRTLAERAQELGTTIRYGPDAKVAHATPGEDRPSVTLVTGEVVTADVVVGADGYFLPGFVTRTMMMEALEQEDEGKTTGLAIYSAVIPESELDKMEDKLFLETIRSSGKTFVWFGGTEWGAQIYPMKAPKTGEALFNMFIFVPHDFESDEYGAGVHIVSVESMLETIKRADPRLKELARHAPKVTLVPVYEPPTLNEWVHPDGRIICLGDGAHPTFTGSTYVFGMSTGDAAVIGRLFRHLHRREQIDSFLSAVEEIRKDRVDRVVHSSLGNIFAVALPPALAEAHDRTLRERGEKGERTAGNRRSRTSEEMMMVIESVFGYDPEDEADDWWVQWGLMQERAAHWTIVEQDQPGALVVEEEQTSVAEQTVVVVGA